MNEIFEQFQQHCLAVRADIVANPEHHCCPRFHPVVEFHRRQKQVGTLVIQANDGETDDVYRSLILGITELKADHIMVAVEILQKKCKDNDDDVPPEPKEIQYLYAMGDPSVSAGLLCVEATRRTPRPWRKPETLLQYRHVYHMYTIDTENKVLNWLPLAERDTAMTPEERQTSAVAHHIDHAFDHAHTSIVEKLCEQMPEPLEQKAKDSLALGLIERMLKCNAVKRIIPDGTPAP